MTLSRGMAVYEQEWVVTKAQRACEEMAAVLVGAVGVNGRAVMAQSTAGVVITRSGANILNLAFTPTDPVFSLLMNSATELHNTLGDGVKTYVIFLNDLLKHIKFRTVHQLTAKLLVLEDKLQGCFNSTCDCLLTGTLLYNVIRTFFSTRFTSVVSETLAKVVYEWISKLPAILDIILYLNNFVIFCLKFTPFPILESKVQEGVLLKGIYQRRLPLNVKECLLKVYYRPVNCTPDASEIEIEILGIIENSNAAVFNILLVTNIFLQERALYMLNQRNIFVIHSVCTDMVKFLFNKIITSKEFIVEYRYVNEFLWISMDSVYQLLLKAPNNTIANEYSDSILDCLRMLHFSFKQSACVIEGNFEQDLAKQLFVVNKRIGPNVPPLVGREQALDWAETCRELNLPRHINVKKLGGIDPEIVKIFCSAFLSIDTTREKCYCVQPLAFKCSVLLKAINTLISILKLDKAIIKPKKERTT